MKKLILNALIVVLLAGCDKEQINNRNPYIPNYSFSEQINMSLPAYSQLQYPSNAIYFPGAGAGGVIVFNTGSGYKAYDAFCPNQEITSCSVMAINGIMAVCPCDSAEYNLFSGQSAGLQYPMKEYRVSVSGMTITVFN